ncbi:MAG: regulatory protein [Actinomycetota bacterium]|nr:regulatory protein [Actinomycetota bacterium]
MPFEPVALQEANPYSVAPGRPDASGDRDALDAAGKFLARRARSESEVRAALARSNFDTPAIEGAIGRLKELGLIDDRAFSRQWIDERGQGRGLGPRRLLSELRLKGVDPDTAEQALEEAGVDDQTQANEIAARLLRKVASRPLAQQAMRLQQMLLGRGFELDVTVSAVRTVLPPEGWD